MDTALVAARAGNRLTPWLVYDLERIAWVVGVRAGDLSDEELRIVRSAAARMAAAVDSIRPVLAD